jgi:hypothetical protein
MNRKPRDVMVPGDVLERARAVKQELQRRQRKPTSKLIREMCLACSSGSPKEVRLCAVFTCPLWLARFGTRPVTVLKSTPELLDPEYVVAEGYRQYSQESSGVDKCEAAQNPTEGALMSTFPNDDDETPPDSEHKPRSRKPR